MKRLRSGTGGTRIGTKRDDRFSRIRGVKRNQRDVAVAVAGRVSPSAIHAFGSVWDCRFTKR
jgi:hypothetical protein